MESDGIMSFGGILQMFSGKSQVSMSAKGMQFYPLHVTLMNSSEERRRKLIGSEV